MSTAEADRRDRAELLVRTVQEAARELHALTAGSIDEVVVDGGGAFLLVEAQQRLRRSEAAQRELAEQQLAILNALSAHIALIDADGIILAVNEAWRRFARANGLRGEALGVGLDYLAVCDEATGESADGARAVADGIRRVLRGESAQLALEYPCHSRTERRWFRLIVTPVLAGRRGGAVVMHDDITEHRSAAERLRESLARSAEAESVAQVGSWELVLHDPDRPSNNTLVVSDELLRIVGVDPAVPRPTAGDLALLLPPDARNELRDAMRSAIRERRPYSLIQRLRRADGTERIVHAVGRSYVDEITGRTLKLVGTLRDITEQTHAEQELRGSRDLLRLASRAARLGAWRLDLPTETMTVSDELRAIHDLPADAEPRLDELVDLYAPEPREVLRRLMDACRRDGTPYDVELPKLTATGRSIWVRSIGEAVRDADGRIVRLQGAGQDITARKLAEHELARMNRALRLLSNCNEVLVRAQSERELLDKVCRIAIEDGGYRLAWVGYANDDEARTISVLAKEGSHAGYLEGLRLSWSPDLPEGGGPAGKTVRTGELVACRDILADTGFAPWVDRARANGIRSVLCLPLREASRTFGVLCLYGGEVSEAGADELKLLQELADDLAFGLVGLRAREEHHRAEQKLREQAALLDQASEAIFVRDLHDRITYWNHGAERLYGWTAAEVVGQDAAELFHRNDAARLALARAALQEVITTGAWVGELPIIDKAARSRLIAARWSLLRDAAGQPRAVLTLNADITEKRELETQLLRTQRLESLGTLAGGIAHDLNNVLTPILSAIAMLNEDETRADKREDLATLEASAWRGAAMVKQLLTFARGEPSAPHKRIDVAALAGDVVKMVRDTFPKDIAAVLRTDGAPALIRGDATQIHQLLTNLCVNARDAMPNGGLLALEIATVVVDDLYAGMSAETPSGHYLRLRVEDTGCGMTPEIRDRIFEPFFTTKPLGAGTGLGLSTCHAIARGHGGFILVASEPGRGARFDVYLPAEAAGETMDEAASARATPSGRGELVLVVDDEAAIRSITRRALERYGYRVLVAANGAEAVALFAANARSIAVVLTDMSMPIMDGPKTIAALQTLDPSVRIIGSTGLHADGKVAEARALGVTDWVPKPYTADVLLRMLRAVIAQGT